MTLKEKSLWPLSSYNSEINNITTEFFNPALVESTTYHRIAGLFDSNKFSSLVNAPKFRRKFL